MLLNGRVILDCSALLPGPYLGKLLAMRGARVLKIESPDRPDPAREMSPAFYRDLNECKEVVSLSLTSSEGRARFAGLVREADGLIEGFRPAAKKKLGLDEASLHAINPRLCIASLVGYPEESPWRDRAGHDLNFEAVTGCASLFAEMPPLPLADLFAAYDGALSLAAALDGVARGGPDARGLRLAISMSESLKSMQSVLVAEFRENGIAPRPGETLFSGKYPCYRLYGARDGRRVSMGAIEPKFWQKACELLGVPQLVAEGYASGTRGREVIAEVQRAFEARDWKDWAPLFESADCCVEPVLTYDEVYGGV